MKFFIIYFLIIIFLNLKSIFFKKNLILIFINLELILISLTLLFIFLSFYFNNLIYSQIISLFILILAACESSLGLSILICYFKLKNNIFFLKNNKNILFIL